MRTFFCAEAFICFASQEKENATFKNLVLAALAPPEGTGDGGVLLDVAASGPRLPELADEGAGLLVVVGADDGLDGLGGFLGVVEGDTAVFFQRLVRGN